MRALITPGHRREPLDGATFDAVYRECAGDVHAYVQALLGDRAAAEDVTALAFERLYRSRSRLEDSRGTPRAWLFAIARNAALDELRRRRRHPEAALAEDRSGGIGPLGADEGPALLDRIARRELLCEALAALGPREREIVLLKFHGQLSNAELARVLGISASNAGTRLHRALEGLRDRYGILATEEVAYPMEEHK